VAGLTLAAFAALGGPIMRLSEAAANRERSFSAFG
jgi:hypothetical protein